MDNFNKEIDEYHGALINKEMYAREFLNMKHQEMGYEVRNIQIVLDSVISECTAIAEALSSGLGRRRTDR